ncbi:MAG: hypothetical protein Q7T73_03250 [Beijerinckiaceae bacterium]|nr:hypothetical protein [Beijerinckiaceae bacterium]
MVRRRREAEQQSWPGWLREFRPRDWPGRDDVERAWAWRAAGIAFARESGSEFLAVLRRIRAVRDTRRVKSDLGLTYDEWKDQQS